VFVLWCFLGGYKSMKDVVLKRFPFKNKLGKFNQPSSGYPFPPLF